MIVHMQVAANQFGSRNKVSSPTHIHHSPTVCMAIDDALRTVDRHTHSYTQMVLSDME